MEKSHSWRIFGIATALFLLLFISASIGKAQDMPLKTAAVPHPVSDILYVKNIPCEQVHFTIYNALGQEITAGSTYGTISVSDLENGFYFLKVKGKDFQKTSKFMVK
ncbi:MAG: T9SS type A sorting domain-containing protein [Bacteroidales bacterium]|nr:T9SS type A sorting domain-containing protein [Bacteroidales bacterium]